MLYGPAPYQRIALGGWLRFRSGQDDKENGSLFLVHTRIRKARERKIALLCVGRAGTRPVESCRR